MRTPNPRRRIGAALISLFAMLCFTALTSAAIGSQLAQADASWPQGTDPCAMPCGTLTDANLRDLVNLMTVTEESTLIQPNKAPSINGEVGSVTGIRRLGIPDWRWTDGPAGIRLGRTETAMPAPVGLVASWDPGTGYLYGATIANDARATGVDGWFGPMVNLVVIPTGGRIFETSGEDVFLASQFARSQVQGVQSRGVVAEIKHFLENDFENQRDQTSVYVDERTLREGELQAFKVAIDAGAMAVMCSHNRINVFVTTPPAGEGDDYACSSDLLQNQVLKGREPFDYGQLPAPALGFQGQVGSDYGATHRSTDLIYGLDQQQPGGVSFGIPIVNAINGSGTVAVGKTNDLPGNPAYTSAQWKAALDNAVFHTLKMYNAAGYLEGTLYGSRSATACAAGPNLPCTSIVPHRPDLGSLQPASFQAAQVVAAKSATLLKNSGGLLPLTCSDFSGSGVLVIGPTAIAPYVGGGGSAHVIPYDPVQSPYDALIAAATATCGFAPVISYTPGYDLDGTIVPSSALTSAFFPNSNANWTVPGGSGDPRSPQAGLLRQQITTAAVPAGRQPILVDPTGATDRVDQTVNYSPVALGTLPVNTAWRWTGTITAPASPIGTNSWQLKIFVANQANSQLFLDGLTPAESRINVGAYPIGPTNSYAALLQSARSHDPLAEGQQQAAYVLNLTAGQQRQIDLRVFTGPNARTQVGFRWVPPSNKNVAIAAATASAAGKNKVIDFVYDDGNEGTDRGGNAIANGLVTPGYQDQVVSAIAGANPNTIVVLNTGDALFMPWASSVGSILDMWYPGQLGGIATADVLMGATNPGGKLPITFPDVAAPLGQRFPQDTQPVSCGNNSANYGSASGLLPGVPGDCPLYPGIYLPGFLDVQLHGYRTINFSNESLGGIPGNGIFTGYRWWDLHNYAPLFEFGRGLSYTTFDYSNLTVQPGGDGIDVSFAVRNSGSVAGDEVPQIYLGPPANAPVPMAVKALAGFTRITLAPGASQNVTIHVGSQQLSYWSIATHDWALASSNRPLYVGSSSRDIRLQVSNALQPALTIATNRPADHGAWYNHPVTISASATAVGGVTIACDAPVTYAGPDSATASVQLSCVDANGNSGSQTITFPYDSTGPVAICQSPDGLWHAADIAIACAVGDGTSGLANAADATLSLETSVVIGTESASASTTSSTVADLAGNSTTVGPIAGNKIDKKAPSIIISAPASTSYLLGQYVTASDSCSDAGSGVTTCIGSVANGSAIDTASLGTKNFTVNATDLVGNPATARVSYQVVPAFPRTVALDYFNRANGSVGTNWFGATTHYQVTSNHLDVLSGGTLVWKTSYGATQEAFVTLSTIDPTSTTQGVLLKVQSGGGTISGAISIGYDAVAQAMRVSTLVTGATVWTQYTNRPVTMVNGDQLGARALNSGDVQIFKNGIMVAKVTLNSADKAFFGPRSGQIGITTLNAPNAVLDDFGGGTLTP